MQTYANVGCTLNSFETVDLVARCLCFSELKTKTVAKNTKLLCLLISFMHPTQTCLEHCVERRC